MSQSSQELLRETLNAFQNADDQKKVTIAARLGLVLESLLIKIAEFSDIPQHFLTQSYPSISLQIQAIDKRTEHAVDKYMGVAERLRKIVADAPDPIKKAVQAEINVMFEASNFQDLVSQHANEIKLLMDDVKADMTDIQSLTGVAPSGKVHERSRNKNKRADDHLLNGPALPEGLLKA